MKATIKIIGLGTTVFFSLITPSFSHVQNSDSGVDSARATVRQQSLLQIANNLSRDSGVTILVDNALTSSQGSSPRVKATPETVEKLLDGLINSLPQGTIWVKVMLPPPIRGQAYRADDVVDYLLAQSRLFGKVGFSVPGGIELMGQQILQDKAQPLINTLGLKPVYIIVNPAQHGSTPATSTAILPSDFISKNSDKLSKMQSQERLSALENIFKSTGMMYRETYNKLGIEDRIAINMYVPSLLQMFMNSVNGK